MNELIDIKKVGLNGVIKRMKTRKHDELLITFKKINTIPRAWIILRHFKFQGIVWWGCMTGWRRIYGGRLYTTEEIKEKLNKEWNNIKKIEWHNIKRNWKKIIEESRIRRGKRSFLRKRQKEK